MHAIMGITSRQGIDRMVGKHKFEERFVMKISHKTALFIALLNCLSEMAARGFVPTSKFESCDEGKIIYSDNRQDEDGCYFLDLHRSCDSLHCSLRSRYVAIWNDVIIRVHVSEDSPVAYLSVQLVDDSDEVDKEDCIFDVDADGWTPAV